MRRFNFVTQGIIIFLISGAMAATSAFADTLLLKSGRKSQGKIVNKDETTVTFEIEGIPVKFHRDEIEQVTEDIYATTQTEGTHYDSEVTVIVLHPLAELDFKTKPEIYELRKQEVMKYPQLLEAKKYTPSEAVFGQIQDKKPWWGILGHCYYGDGQQSIAGASEESRFLMNPFLLVGLDTGSAVRLTGSPLPAREIYPMAYNLEWNKAKRTASVKYNVARFREQAKQYNYPEEMMRIFALMAYNARDLGYEYLYVDPEASENITSLNETGAPLAIPFFIHTGYSCGYPGGCNNMSPQAPNFRIRVKQIPAAVHIRLWKKAPARKDANADMVFVIHIM